MSTMEQARVALVTKIEALKATWLAYPLLVQYDNRESINYSTQVNPFLRVSIDYFNGAQIALGPNGGHRMMGVILLEAWVKVGQGSKLGNDLLLHFYPSIHMTDLLPPLRTRAAEFRTGNKINGWIATAAVIGFHHDVL